MEEINLWENHLVLALGGSVLFNVKKKDMKYIYIESWQLVLTQRIFKVLILVCVVFASSNNLVGQTRVSLDLTYDKTGQLILENMPEYFWTQFFYDKSGNRLRKYTYSQIIGGVEGDEIGEAKNIKVFPIPASSYVSVSTTLQKAGYVSISIISIEGKKYYSEKKYMEVGEGVHKINLSDLPDGSYILELISDEGKYSRLIIMN